MKRKTRTAVVAFLSFAAALVGDHAAAQPGARYPYVASGTKIVVNRDRYGGVKTDMLFRRRLANGETAADAGAGLSLPARFEVKASQGSFSYVQAKECGSGWRMPTYRELLLTLLLYDDLNLKSEMPQNGKIWSSSWFDDESKRYICYMSTGSEQLPVSILGAVATEKCSVQICVRDIVDPDLSLPDA